MRKYYVLFILCLIQIFPIVSGQAGRADEVVEKEMSEEDLEIIGNLDFLENIDMLEQDLSFLEEYEVLDEMREDDKDE